jgi:hypothetical protein
LQILVHILSLSNSCSKSLTHEGVLGDSELKVEVVGATEEGCPRAFPELNLTGEVKDAV